MSYDYIFQKKLLLNHMKTKGSVYINTHLFSEKLFTSKVSMRNIHGMLCFHMK